MTDIKLRDYQRKFIDAVRDEFLKNHKRVVGVAPCGAGKTIMTGWMIKESLNRDKRSIFFVHRHELIEQTSKTFTALDIPHGIISAGEPMNLNLPVQIASVQTLARRLNDIRRPPDFLICDECHHILANTYKKILDAFPNAFLLGVTATPQRRGGITLHDVFNSMVESISVDELIKLGNLAPFKYFAPTLNIDYESFRTVCGDYSTDDMAKALRSPLILGNIVDNYNLHAKDTSAICYCVNVEHSNIVAQSFKDADISAEAVDGETPKKLRAEIIESFRQGEIKVLCNAELFGEGFDVPKCQTVILARPTKSLTLYIQQAMRSMRPDPLDPNKVAIIIDLVKNHERHGYPNKYRYWSLMPNKEEDAGEAPTKTCPICGEEVFIGARFCPNCEYQFPLIEINEVDAETVLQDTSQDNPATTPEEFMLIAKQHNYKRGWVVHQSLKFADSYDYCLRIAKVCGYKKGWAYYAWNDICQQKNFSPLTGL